MNICIPFDELNSNEITFDQPVSNFIKPDSMFIQMNYKTPLLNLSRIYAILNTLDPYMMINLQSFERDVLNTYLKNTPRVNSKIPEYNKNIATQFQRFKTTINRVYDTSSDPISNNKEDSECLNKEVIPYISYQFMIKLTGIWETNMRYGIIYKFVYAFQPSVV
jgi:hypothetical protein